MKRTATAGKNLRRLYNYECKSCFDHWCEQRDREGNGTGACCKGCERCACGEMQNFQVNINDLANDSYGAWSEGTHDDLALAVALSHWATDFPVPPRAISPKSPSSTAKSNSV